MWDLNSLVAIDIHTHAHTPPEFADPEELEQREAIEEYFGTKGEELTTLRSRTTIASARSAA